jgi:hypothetical protein
MHPAVVFLIFIMMIVLLFWALITFKVKMAVNLWTRIKAIFGKKLRTQASNTCPGSDFSFIVDDDSKDFYDYINESKMCPKDRIKKESDATQKCSSLAVPVPAQVIATYPDDRVTNLATNCSSFVTKPADWEDTEFNAWKNSLNTKCKSSAFNKSISPTVLATITKPHTYTYWSNTFSNDTTMACPGDNYRAF